MVAGHCREEEGPKAAVVKFVCTDYVAFIRLYISTWRAVSVVLVLD